MLNANVWFKFLLIATSFSPLYSVLQAQQPQPAAQPQTPGAPANESLPTAPALKVTTRMVVVDAIVTDGSGKPVPGLKATDFEVRENGHPQVIRAFGSREPVQGSGKPFTPRVLPPGVFTNVPDFNPEDGPPTIVLVDALNTLLKDQAYLHDQFLKYLKSIGPHRNVAIYTLGSRLRLVQDFTSDPKLLQEALKRVSFHSSPLNQDPNAQSDVDFADDQLASMAQSLKDFQAEQNAVLMDMRVRTTVNALKDLGRNVAGYPGRKNLIWLSGAFPFYIGADTELTNPFVSQRTYGEQIQEAATVLEDSQVAVYPVDARGLVGSFMPDASERVSLGRNPGAALGTRISKASADLSSSHDAMNEIAKETGGRAFYNRNDIDRAIALSVDDGSAYYTLGYYPDDKNWNGKFRKLEIRLTEKGLHVRHRRGYFANALSVPAVPNDKAAQREFTSALSLEAPAATSLPFAARVSPPTKEEPQITVSFGVDPQSVLFEAAEDGLRHATVDFVTLAFDRKGKLVASQSNVLNTALKAETYNSVMANRLPFSQKIALAPGKYTLKLGVFDQKTRLIGTANANVVVPAD